MLVESVGVSQFMFTCENGKCGVKAVTSSPDTPPLGWCKVKAYVDTMDPEERPEGFEGMVCSKCAKRWKHAIADSHSIKKGRSK